MRFFVYATLFFPLASVPLARIATARLHPRCATWLLSGASVVLAATSCGALGLLAMAALIRIPLLAQLGHWSSTVVDSGDSTSAAVALVAGVLFGAALLATAVFVVGRTRALVDAFAHARGLPGSGAYVVLRDRGADAYTVPGWPGRVVVSEGMLDALDRPGRQALLAHENAHLTERHYVYTTAARLAAAANPLLRPLAGAVEYAVERWADEDAARTVGDRHQVATAVARAALAAQHSPARFTPAVALGAVFSRNGGFLPGDAGPVPRRVAALLGPAPRTSLIALASALALVAVAGFSALEAAHDLHALLSLAHHAVDPR